MHGLYARACVCVCVAALTHLLVGFGHAALQSLLSISHPNVEEYVAAEVAAGGGGCNIV